MVRVFYESGALPNPQLTARISNGVGSAPDQYDLSLLTYNDAGKFNLTRLDAGGVAGIRNVTVEGDVLTAVSSQAAAFFKIYGASNSSTVDSTPAGIRLPLDNLAGIGVRDFIPNDSIQVASIYVDTSGKTPVVTSTVVQANGIGGKLISRGDLISQVVVHGPGLTGVIAAQGNLGKQFTSTAGKTTRLGGLVAAGPVNGNIVVLGSMLGDVTINGGLKAGHIAAQAGIVGNLTLNGGTDAASAIVSGAAIGDASLGTKFTFNGDNKGIVAAESVMNFAGKTPNGAIYNNVGAGNPNKAALDAVFTNLGQPLHFDLNGLDLAGLDLVLADLAALKVGSNGILTGPKA